MWKNDQLQVKNKQPISHTDSEKELKVRSTEINREIAVTLWVKFLEQSSKLNIFEDNVLETPKDSW